MRKILFLIITILFCGSFFYCKHSTEERRFLPKPENPAIKNLEEKTSIPDTTILAFYRDTIEGIFDGKQKDLLISEPIKDSYEPLRRIGEYDDVYSDCFYSWRVYSQKGTVKELYLENTVRIELIKEGDLDGDGKDEWGFISVWPTSSWNRYNLYKNYNGSWKLMIEPTTIWFGHLGEGEGEISPEQIIQKSKKRGFVKVKFSDVSYPQEKFLIIDTLIKINK